MRKVKIKVEEEIGNGWYKFNILIFFFVRTNYLKSHTLVSGDYNVYETHQFKNFKHSHPF